MYLLTVKLDGCVPQYISSWPNSEISSGEFGCGKVGDILAHNKYSISVSNSFKCRVVPKNVSKKFLRTIKDFV